MEFWVSLIKTTNRNYFLERNCTHVTDDYWIFEGDVELLEDELDSYEIVTEGGVPCLGGMSQQEIIDGCEEWFGFKPGEE